MFVKILLKLADFVGNETESVVQRQPLDIIGIFFEVFPQLIEFREQRFRFHYGSLLHAGYRQDTPD
jgi:hypothetical protein